MLAGEDEDADQKLQSIDKRTVPTTYRNLHIKAYSEDPRDSDEPDKVPTISHPNIRMLRRLQVLFLGCSGSVLRITINVVLVRGSPLPDYHTMLRQSISG